MIDISLHQLLGLECDAEEHETREEVSVSAEECDVIQGSPAERCKELIEDTYETHISAVFYNAYYHC